MSSIFGHCTATSWIAHVDSANTRTFVHELLVVSMPAVIFFRNVAHGHPNDCCLNVVWLWSLPESYRAHNKI